MSLVFWKQLRCENTDSDSATIGQLCSQHRQAAHLHQEVYVSSPLITTTPQEETATSIPTNFVFTHKLTLPTVQEETAPTGWTVRGQYAVSSSFVDDDKKTHLQFEWAFEIDKDW